MSSPSRVLMDALRPDSNAELLRCAPEDLRSATLHLAASERLSATLGWRAIDLGWVAAPSLSLAEFALARGVGDPWTRLAATAVVNATRTMDLRAQLTIIGAALDAAQVAWIPLKGAALLQAGSWPRPEARAMTDLDLWIPETEQVPTAAGALAELGYRPVQGNYAGHHHLPPLMLAGHAGSVEVHTRPVPERDSALLPTPPMLARARDQCLATADLIRHIVVHSRLTDRALRLGRLDLRSVLDVGYLVAAEPSALAGVPQPSDTPGLRRAISVHLAGVAALFGSIPEAVLTRRAIAWWRRARWLADEPRRAWWWQQAAVAPTAARRSYLETQLGRPLTGVGDYRRQVAARVRRTWSARPH